MPWRRNVFLYQCSKTRKESKGQSLLQQFFWRKRERARAGIEPTAAAPSQPDCPGVRSGWLGAAAVGSIPALALSLFLQCLYFLLFLQCQQFYCMFSFFNFLQKVSRHWLLESLLQPITKLTKEKTSKWEWFAETIYNANQNKQEARDHEAPQASVPWQTHTPSWMAPKLLSDKSTNARNHCMHFQKRRHLLGRRSVDDHQLAQTPKEAFSKVRVHAGTTQVDVEIDHQPPADSEPPGDHLITMVKGMVKRVSKNEKKSESCSYFSLIW